MSTMNQVRLIDGEEIEIVSEKSEMTITNSNGKIGVKSGKGLHTIKRYTVEDYLNQLAEDNPCKAPLIQMYKKWEGVFLNMPAGAKKHHTQIGGLEKHTAEVIALGIDMKWLRKNLFSEVPDEDIIIGGFLHDFSKVKMYRRVDKEEESKGYPFKFDNQLGALDPETWTLHQCLEFKVPLKAEHINSLYWAEGGWSSWANRSSRPEWTKLGALISCADLYSAMVMGR
jgi:hypothetical protein